MGQLGSEQLQLQLQLWPSRRADRHRGRRIRGNTLDFSKMVKPDQDALGAFEVRKTCRFPLYWDPELRASVYVNEFVRVYPEWETHLQKPSIIGVCPKDMSEPELRQQLLQMLNKAVERERRFFEIIQQHDAAGAIDYWHGMLMLTPWSAAGDHVADPGWPGAWGAKPARDVPEGSVPLPATLAALPGAHPDDRPRP